MKGFLSFVILFAIILLILHSLYPFAFASFSTEKLLSIERLYQLEMNLKESFFEGAREGAIEGISIYVLSIPITGFNIEEAKQYVRIAVHEKLSSLNSVDFEDFEFELWCGNPSKKELNDLKKSMLSNDELLVCNSCKSVENLNCIESIEPEFSLEIEPGELPELSSVVLGKVAYFGISIYSKKFEISSAFLIPKQEVVFLE